MSAEQRITGIVAAHLHREGPLLPILHDIQAQFGCVSPQAEAQLASLLNLTRAEIHGVVSFYHDFTQQADPRPYLEICRAEACQARGVDALMEAARNAAKVNGIERVRLKDVYCLGLCSVGPVARQGHALHARLDARRLASLIEQA